MDEIRDVVLGMLRTGQSTTQIKQDLMEIIQELKSLELYAKAIQEANFRP